MPKRSAGLLLYRRTSVRPEVLLAHPGGPLWAGRDEGAWSIPKGEFAEPEDPLVAARREFAEETGVVPAGTFEPLEPVRQTGGKLVFAWALEMDLDPGSIRSGTFSMEWPPESGRRQEFPEVDRVAWWPIGVARVKIVKGQRPLLDELERKLTAAEK
jgi:predicted NUDIX family NTP pyrophosphohydrolase